MLTKFSEILIRFNWLVCHTNRLLLTLSSGLRLRQQSRIKALQFYTIKAYLPQQTGSLTVSVISCFTSVLSSMVISSNSTTSWFTGLQNTTYSMDMYWNNTIVTTNNKFAQNCTRSKQPNRCQVLAAGFQSYLIEFSENDAAKHYCLLSQFLIHPYINRTITTLSFMLLQSLEHWVKQQLFVAHFFIIYNFLLKSYAIKSVTTQPNVQ